MQKRKHCKLFEFCWSLLIETTRSLLVMSISVLCMPSLLLSLPQGQKVVNGHAQFHKTGAHLDISPSDNAIIQYQGFDILQNESVRFIQNSKQSRVLNQVIGKNASQILGRLQANGQVYLLNPSGIFFGSQAVVDVSALYAVAGSMSQEDFLNGLDQFDPLSQSIINEGIIRADLVYLFGQDVINKGSIIANDGLVSLVAGDRVLLGEREGNVFIEVKRNEASSLEPGQPAILQAGNIEAQGGEVHLGTTDVFSALGIAHDGKTLASVIHLDAGGADAKIAGNIQASNEQKGGLVSIEANNIEIENALIDASGEEGGGRIYIGGNYQGEGDLKNASTNKIGEHVSILANAHTDGEGGEVIIWSDDYTEFYGKIEAKGGSKSGDGGFAEVSGKDELLYRGIADLRAPNGLVGSLLLDPTDLDIDAAYASTINSQLNSADLILDASNNITVSSAVNSTGNLNLLTLDAGNAIAINADITLTGGLSLLADGDIDISADVYSSTGISINADYDDSGLGTLDIASGFSVATNNKDITLIAADINLEGTVNAGSKAVIIASSNDRDIGFGDTVDDFHISVSEAANITTSGLLLGDGSSNTITVDNITTSNAPGLGDVVITSGAFSTTGSPSSFDSLDVYSDYYNIDADLSSEVGSLRFYEDSVVTGTLIDLADGVQLTSADNFRIEGSGTAHAEGALDLLAVDELHLDINLIADGDVNINADTDGVDVSHGHFELTAGKVIDTQDNDLSIRASDLYLDGSIDTGLGDLTLNSSSQMHISLGNYPATAHMFIVSTDELSRITVGGSTFIGDAFTNIILLDDISAEASDGFTGMVYLTTPRSDAYIYAVNNPSTFNSLSMSAGRLVVFDVDVTTDSGDFIIDGDSDLALEPDVTNWVRIRSNVTLTSGGDLSIKHTSHTITSLTGVGLYAAGDVHIQSDYLGNDLVVVADSDADGTGDFILDPGMTFSLSGYDLDISANDIDLSGSMQDMGDIIFRVSDGGSIGLGDADKDFDLSKEELSRISTSGNVQIGDSNSGSITVDNVSETDSDSISGMLTLDATGDNSSVSFENADSTFNALTVNSDNGIILSVDLTTDSGDLILEADYDNSSDGADRIDFVGARSLSSAEAISLDATTLGIRADADLTLTSANGISINNTVTVTNGLFTLDTDSDDNGTGDFNLASGKNINLQSGEFDLDITANDVDLLGNIYTNAGSAIFRVSDGGDIGLGDAIEDFNLSKDELSRITASGVTIGDADSGSIIVDNVEMDDSSLLRSVILNAIGDGKSVSFVNNPSAFYSLGINADDGINFSADLSTFVGNLLMNADYDDTADSSDSYIFTGARTINSFAHLGLTTTSGSIITDDQLNLIANINVSLGNTLDAQGDVNLLADYDNNGSGALVIRAVDTHDHDFFIQGAIPYMAGIVNVGSGDLTIEPTGEKTVGLGTGSSDFMLSSYTMSFLYSSGTTKIGGTRSSSITVDSLASSSSDGLTGTLILDATGDNSSVSFINGASTFQKLTVRADDGINIAADVTALAGDFVLEADYDNDSDSSDAIVFTGARTLTSAGSISLDATTGGVSSDDVVSVIAAEDLVVNDDFTAGADLVLNADSDGNGSGDFQVASSMQVYTADNNLTIEANDIDLLGSVRSYEGLLTMIISDDGNIGIGDAIEDFNLSKSELSRINAGPGGTQIIVGEGGSITIDNVESTDSSEMDGLTIFDATANGGTINVEGGDSTFDSFFMKADDGVTISADLFAATNHAYIEGNNDDDTDTLDVISFVGDRSVNTRGLISLQSDVTTSGNLFLNGDSDDNGSGTVGTHWGIAFNTNDHDLTMHGENISVGAIFNLGSGDLKIIPSAGTTIGLGNASGDLTLTNTNLSRIYTSGTVQFGDSTSSSITVDGVNSASSDGLTGLVILDATANGASVTFENEASTFGELSVRADDGINILADLTTESWDLLLDADYDNAPDSSDAIVFSGARIISSSGRVDLDATTGGITADDDLTINSAGYINIYDNLDTYGSTSLLADDNNNDAGNFVIASGKTVNTHDNDLTIMGNNVEILGSLDAGSGDLSFLVSDGGSIGLGDTGSNYSLSKDELSRMTSTGTIKIGDSTSGSIIVDNIELTDLANLTGTLTLDATNASSSINVQTNSSSFHNLTAKAGNDINITVDLSVDSGELTLQADTDASGAGELVLSSGNTIDTHNYDLELKANDMDLSGNVDVGAGDLTILVSDGEGIGLGDANQGLDLSKTELSHLTVGGETIIGDDSNINVTVDNVSASDSDALAGMVTLSASGYGGKVNFSGGASTFNSLTALAGRMVQISADVTTDTGDLIIDGDYDDAMEETFTWINVGDGLTLSSAGNLEISSTTGGIYNVDTATYNAVEDIIFHDTAIAGSVIIHADSDGNGSGDFTIASAKTIRTDDSLEIIAHDIDILGTLNAQTGSLTLMTSDGGTIGLGDADKDFDISGAELSRMTASGAIQIGSSSSGSITVDNILSTDSDNLTGVLTLDATKDGAHVTFENGDSTFQNLIVQADDGIDIAADVTTVSGDLTLDADYDMAADSDDALSLTGARTLTSAGLIHLSALTGGISSDDALTIEAVSSVSVDHNLSTMGQTSITADSDSDGAGDFVLSSGALLDTQDNELTLKANDIDLSGSLSTGSGDLNLQVSDGGAIGLGDADKDFDISGAELSRMSSAGSIQIGDNTSGSITVDNVLESDSDALTGALTLDATKDGAHVTFENGDSTFQNLIVQADDGIGIAADVTTVSGDLTLDADYDMAADTDDALSLAGARTLTSAGSIHLSALTGGISSDDALTIEAVSSVSVDHNLSTMGQTSITADSDSDGAGDFVLSSGALLDTQDNELTLKANDIDLSGSLSTGSGDLNLQVSDGGTIGLGDADKDFDISGAELSRMTASGAIQIGDNTSGSITVDNVLESDSDALTGALTLDATKDGADVTFENGDSTFQNLMVQADDGIDIAANVTTVSGDLTLDADYDMAADTDDALSLTGARTLTSAGLIHLSALTGGISSDDALTIEAVSSVSVDHNLSTMGQTSITADSDSDGTGDFVLSSGALLDTQDNELTLKANDIDLSGSLSTGSGDLNLQVSDGGAIGLGDADKDFDISGAELSRMTASGAIQIGDNTSGSITVDNVLESDSDALTGTLTLDATKDGTGVTFENGDSAFQSLIVQADDGIDVSANLTTVSGDLSLHADSDADGLGDVSVASGKSLDTSNYTLTLKANDVDLSGSLSTGSGDLNLQVSDGGAIGLGDADKDFDISGAELSRMSSAGSIQIGDNTSGSITVDNVLESDSDALTGALTLDATKDGAHVTFENGDSTFQNLIVQADDGIDIAADVTTVSGDLTLDADYDMAADSDDALSLTGARTLTSAGLIHLSALTGGISSDDALTIEAVSSVSVDHNLSTVGQTSITADSDSDGAGDFILSSGALLDTQDNELTLKANDIDLSGSLRTGSGDLNLQVSDGGTIGLGDADKDFDISGAELSRMTASGAIQIGDNTSGSITVDNILAAYSNGLTGVLTLDATADGADVTFENGDSAFQSLTVQADDDIDVSANLTTVSGDLSLHADSDADGLGDVSVASDKSLDTSNYTLTLTANDVDLSGSLSTGSGDLNLQVSDGGTIGLGDADKDFDISGAELSRMTASGAIQIGDNTSGSITVDNVLESDSDALTGALILDATADGAHVTFENGGSTFQNLIVQADDGIDIAVNVTTVSGDLTLDADYDMAADTDDALSLTGARTLTSAGLIHLSALTGGISSDDALTIEAVSSVSVDHNLSIMGQTSITADSDSDGAGDFVLSSGALLDTQDNELTLKANDIDLSGSLSTGSGDLNLQVSDGGAIGLGDADKDFDISGAELSRITASGAIQIGDNTSGSITVDNVLESDSDALTGALTLDATKDGADVTFENGNSVFRQLSVKAAEGINLTAGLNTQASVLSLDADSDLDNDGVFSLASSKNLLTNDYDLMLLASDVNIQGSIDTGEAKTYLSSSNYAKVAIGNTQSGVSFHLNNEEIAALSTSELLLKSGDVFVSNANLFHNTNTKVQLRSMGENQSIVLGPENNLSGELELISMNNIELQSNLSLSGRFTARADYDDNQTGNFSLKSGKAIVALNSTIEIQAADFILNGLIQNGKGSVQLYASGESTMHIGAKGYRFSDQEKQEYQEALNANFFIDNAELAKIKSSGELTLGKENQLLIIENMNRDSEGTLSLKANSEDGKILFVGKPSLVSSDFTASSGGPIVINSDLTLNQKGVFNSGYFLLQAGKTLAMSLDQGPLDITAKIIELKEKILLNGVPVFYRGKLIGPPDDEISLDPIIQELVDNANGADTSSPVTSLGSFSVLSNYEFSGLGAALDEEGQIYEEGPKEIDLGFSDFEGMQIVPLGDVEVLDENTEGDKSEILDYSTQEELETPAQSGSLQILDNPDQEDELFDEESSQEGQ